MADDDTLTTASTYWRDAAVLAETFQQKKRPPPKPPTPDLTGMPKLKEHVRIAASRRSSDSSPGEEAVGGLVFDSERVSGEIATCHAHRSTPGLKE